MEAEVEDMEAEEQESAEATAEATVQATDITPTATAERIEMAVD